MFQASPSLSSVSSGPTRHQALFQGAQVLYLNGELTDARTLVTQCLQIQPNWTPVLRLSLKVFHHTPEQRLRILELIAAEDASLETQIELAHQHFSMQNYLIAKEKYFECLSQLLDVHPELFEIYKNLGNIFCLDGDWDAAEEYYMKALASRPSSGIIRCNLGFMEIQKSHFESAEIFFQQALMQQDAQARAWAGLALVDFHREDWEMAKAHVLKSLDVDRDNRVALQTLGNVCLQMRDFSSMVDPFSHYLMLHPMDHEMRAAFVHLLESAGMREAAAFEREQLESFQ